MLPSVKNKQTMDILRKLKAKGAPPPAESATVPDLFADMEQPEPGEEALEPGPDGTVVDEALPGVASVKALRRRRKAATPTEY